MDMILVAGLWLDASAWDPVLPALRDLGQRPVAVALPGQGAPPADAALADQLGAVVEAVDAADGPVMVVGHSAASTLAWLAADARPDKVVRVAMVGGFPSRDGSTYADFFEAVDWEVPFPGWEPFEGPDSQDLDADAREAFEARTVTVPASVTKDDVRYTDERRFDIPITLVCPEYSPAEAREWVASGDLPELTRASQVDYADIDSGHWPMVSRPAELARLLAEIADS